MSASQKAAGPFARSLQQSQALCYKSQSIRPFTTSCTFHHESTSLDSSPSTPKFDPLTVTSPRGERALLSNGISPIGSRRRRAALRSSDNIPFEELPYQCFQEARKILQADRAEKLLAIEKERMRITRLSAQDASTIPGGEKQKQTRLHDMQLCLEKLKVLADINDPLVKKRFEDGEGDMNKPVYRYLADKKWRSYQRLVIVQRFNQLSVVPDLLAHLEPTADVRMAFRRRKVQPGEFIDSRVSEVLPKLNIQVFDKGERLVTIVIVDSDVPIVEEDNFMHRCHFLATNISISPTNTSLPLSKVTDKQLVLPWLPPFAQKGSPYHRYSAFVLQQKPGQVLDSMALKDYTKRDGFKLKGFVDRHGLQPIGLGLFRSIWDEGTAGVMERAGVEGADIEFKRKRIPALKPKQKARGWEARHASDKYKSLRR